MGQRFQVYIRIHNPLKNKSIVEDLSRFNQDGSILKQAKRLFGNKKTSILAFHHQWLYGVTAAAICANIMREVTIQRTKSSAHILSTERDEFPYPVDYTGDKTKVDGYMEVVKAIFFNQFNAEFAEHGARYGIERVIDLSKDCFDKNGKYDKRYDCRVDFRGGDNNDGIMIIDAIKNKYCFIHRIYGDVKTLVPISAEKYVKTYRPTEKSKLMRENDERDEDKIQEMLKDNRETAAFVKEAFSNFNLLTLDDVKEIFPAVYKVEEKVAEKK